MLDGGREELGLAVGHVVHSASLFPSRLREGLGEGREAASPVRTGPPPTPPASGRGGGPAILNRCYSVTTFEATSGCSSP
ncbi:hypothetical protein EAH76_19965 [Sphingomonas glacialis]|uniref:Uncharacterized protein n=1 Tax=Sphingomonas glacialis TaxID=658225 RepID=A0A502FJ00_9SPHN|nr:hypothetical protein EAH76_19965 [Sphingomonas glacialis]